MISKQPCKNVERFNLVHVVGARPNFMKVAPVYHALNRHNEINQLVVHTGQHFDANMSDVFFREFDLPLPDVHLSINGKTALQQIGKGVLELEKALPKLNAEMVLIYGDVNATAFTAIVCSKFGIKLGHVEAGLRSFDRTMPEETNRIVADALSDYFFTPSADADENLLKEGVEKEKIFRVGNVMIDTLKKFLPQVRTIDLNFPLPDQYALVTLHRPSNVDSPENLEKTLEALNEIAADVPVIFPLHPRTKKALPDDFFETNANLIFTGPLGYMQFLKLQAGARFVVTDSGGVQEETTYLGIPCFTFRNNTERPITVTTGTNTLVGTDPANLKSALKKFLNGHQKKGSVPPLWDGQAGERIAKIVVGLLKQDTSFAHEAAIL